MKHNGQSLLALVILIGSVVAIIGITLAFLASSFVDSSYGYQASALAEAAATSGAEDALLQLDRNTATSSYSLAVGSTTATITITQNSPSANFVTVLSQSTVAGRTRKIDIVLAQNASTTQMTVVSWQEIQ